MSQALSPIPPVRYSGVAIALHWLIAALIAANLVLIWFVDSWPKDWTRPVIDTHKSIGITVMGLALLRLLWRAGHPPPPLPDAYPPIERRGALAAHVLLYVLIVAIPLSGWLHDSAWKDAASHPMSLFGLIPWPRIGPIMDMAPAAKEQLHTAFFALHQWLAYGLYALFILHVGGTLKHQFIDKEPELQRMLP
jgi:cytochrome b561